MALLKPLITPDEVVWFNLSVVEFLRYKTNYFLLLCRSGDSNIRTYGAPEDVLKEIELLEQVGIQYIIVDLEPSRELAALKEFANKIINK